MGRRIVIHNHLPKKSTTDEPDFRAEQARQKETLKTLKREYENGGLSIEKLRTMHRLEKLYGAGDRKTKDDFSDSHLMARANEARFFSGPYVNQLAKCISDLKTNPNDPAYREALKSITASAFRTQYIGDKAKDAKPSTQQLRIEGVIAANESSWADLLEDIRTHNLTPEQAGIVKEAYKTERKKLMAKDALPKRVVRYNSRWMVQENITPNAREHWNDVKAFATKAEAEEFARTNDDASVPELLSEFFAEEADEPEHSNDAKDVGKDYWTVELDYHGGSGYMVVHPLGGIQTEIKGGPTKTREEAQRLADYWNDQRRMAGKDNKTGDRAPVLPARLSGPKSVAQ